MNVALKYYGAHTGRYSGDGGINLQNLPAHVSGLASRIRGLLRAGEGHKLVIVDAAQIEARVLAWFAGQEDLLTAFAQQIDPYARFASKVFGETVRKPTADDSPEVKAKLGSRRQLGKVCVLGLGYQAGIKRFVEMVRSDPVIGQLCEDGSLTDEFLTQVHREYRRTNAKIVQSWRDTQAAFADAIRGQHGLVGCVLMTRDAEAVYIELPSGRRLVYADPTIDMTGEMHYRGGKVYGGLLVENIIQAISRDVLVDAMLALEAQGYPVAFTVHDEIVLRVRTEEAETALAAAIEALSVTPSWASELPLAAEGRVSDCYGK